MRWPHSLALEPQRDLTQAPGALHGPGWQRGGEVGPVVGGLGGLGTEGTAPGFATPGAGGRGQWALSVSAGHSSPLSPGGSQMVSCVRVG